MKNITILFTILGVIFFFSNCTQNKEKSTLEFKISEDIECFTIPYPDILGISMQLLKNDSLLLINDFRGDSLIHIFDVNNQNLLRKLISVGNGPNELISPLEIHIHNNNLYIYCRQRFFLYSMLTDSLLDGSKNMIKRFQTPSEASRLFPLSDSLFISSGYYQKRYALFDGSGVKTLEFGEYPAYWSNEEQIPVEARAMFHQVNFEKHPTSSLFLGYSSHVLDIYDYSSKIDCATLVKRIPMGKYNYTFTTGQILSAEKGADVEKGIVSVSCSSKYIYIVYNSKKNNSEKKDSQIYVIDWDGNPIKVLNPQKNITCLYIDEKENKGYIIAQESDDTLMYFYLENKDLLLNNHPKTTKNIFPEEYSLKHKKIFVDEIFQPDKLAIVSDYLFLTCSVCDSMIFQFSLPDFKIIHKFGHKGQGPGEFLHPYIFSDNPNRLTIWGFSDLKKIRQYYICRDNNIIDIKHDNKIILTNPNKEFVMSEYQGYNQIHLIRDSFLVFSAIPTKFLLGKINLYDQMQVNEYNLKLNPDVKEVFFQDNMGVLSASDEGIAFLYKYKNKIDFFDTNFNLITSTNSDAKKLAVSTDPSLSSFAENINCYNGYYSGHKYLYALYFGYSFEDSKKPEYKPCVEKYDWKGKKIAKYNLDVRINLFAVNEDTNKLYGYNSSDEDYFYEFDLSVTTSSP
ncbi:hypothetical protein AGMMS50239_24950 [Bacteroidia bacterium]|nr:hypothetical protein AGMMS50239_24950 [Bacteroidia bacterium]